MTESPLERRLKNALQAAEPAPPEFDALFARAAEAARRKRRRRPAAAALAAGIGAVAVAVWLWPGAPADSALLAELTRTTSWRAPSDSLMPPQRNDLLNELPVFGTVRIPEGDLTL